MAGNWKMYKTAAETAAFFDKFKPLVEKSDHCDIVICPTFPNLPAAVDAAKGSAIEIGGQNLFWEKEGAYTGEVSGPMLVAVGARWVIIGHSERRHYFAETDQTVLKRTVAALAAGLHPIVCVGERIEQREAGKTEEVLHDQFTGGISALAPEQFAKIVIAYEPVWAIGTGEKCDDEEANRVCGLVRRLLAQVWGAEKAQGVRVLYGGSVDAQNAPGLMRQPEVDGGLVGGKSLIADDFEKIVRAAQQGKGMG